MNDKQREALKGLCERYNVPFEESNYRPTFDLPEGWVAGWVGNIVNGFFNGIYVGCSPEGHISSS